MSRTKELFMAAQNQLIEEYMEKHPETDEFRAALAISGEAAMERMVDNLADRIDYYRQLKKDGNI